MKMSDLDDFKGRITQKHPKITISPPDLVQKCNLRALVGIDCNIYFSHPRLYNT